MKLNQSVVDELNANLPDVLDAIGINCKFVDALDPRLNQQLLLRWTENMSFADGLMMVVSEIKSNDLVLTPFKKIGAILIHAYVSSTL